MSIRSSGIPFDLSVDSSIRNASGTVKAYDTILSGTFGYSTTELSTGITDKIKWVMTDETRTDVKTGIKPGSYGNFTFNVIPRVSGNLKVHFTIDLTGYYARFELDENNVIDPTQISFGTLESLEDRMISDSGSAAKYQNAMNYLKGHILFYESYTTLTETELNGSTDSHTYYAKRIDPEEGFDREFIVNDEMVGQPQQVIVYWIWPNTFAQMEYDNGNSNLIDPAMFSSNQAAYELEDETTITPRAELMRFIAAHPGLFFNSTIIASKSEADIATMLTLTNADDIITLSNGYNNADQIIGETVKLVLVEIEAGLATD